VAQPRLNNLAHMDVDDRLVLQVLKQVATTVGRVKKEQFALATRQRATAGHSPHAQLCDDLAHLQDHINLAVTAIKRPYMCHVRGEPAYSKCRLCDVTLYYFLKRGAHTGAECFLLYHSETFFGLAKSDVIMVKKRKQDKIF
jgi:hypothetical protein